MFGSWTTMLIAALCLCFTINVAHALSVHDGINKSSMSIYSEDATAPPVCEALVQVAPRCGYLQKQLATPTPRAVGEIYDKGKGFAKANKMLRDWRSDLGLNALSTSTHQYQTSIRSPHRVDTPAQGA